MISKKLKIQLRSCQKVYKSKLEGTGNEDFLPVPFNIKYSA